MSTRALTYVYEEKKKKPFFCMYSHYDGYPSHHGRELSTFLDSRSIVDSLEFPKPKIKVFIGMNCLAAQLVCFFKKDAGGFYIHDVNSKTFGIEYEYHIYSSTVKVLDVSKDKILFDDSWENFKTFCN